MLKTFIRYYKPYKALFMTDMVVAFIVAGCDLVYPMMTRTLINEAIPNEDLELLGIFAIGLLTIFIIKALGNYFMQYWGHVVGVRMQADMRRDIYKHLQRLPNTYFDNNKTGETMSRIVNDLMEVSELAHHGPEDLFVSLVMIIGSFLILININVPLTLLIFAFIPLIFLFTWKNRRRMSNAFTESRVTTGEVNATLENSISGMRVTKSFNSFDYELEKFETGNKNFANARQKAYKVMAQYFSGAIFSLDILDYVSMIGGGLFTYYNLISIGDFMAYLLYVKMFTQPIRKLTFLMEQYQNGMTGFKRFQEIMEEPTEIERENAVDVEEVQGEIVFNDVDFKYEDEYILKDLNLTIPKGKMFALVGASGGGKTTLCNLIPRFYDVTDGEITLDGQDIRDMKLESLRDHIGVVQQEVFLFTGTIKENILYGKTTASEEEIIEAAKKANIHDFIMTLDKGYDTYIGERGVKLSGGQKQRLSIARVFLKDPSILILDEATSALDNATEYMIKKSIDEVCKGRTTLVVAHRLSTIQNADTIVVLGPNGIEEQGSHTELMTKAGVYKDLYESQFEALIR